MNGLSWVWKWKYVTMILFCSRAQLSNQIINLGAASNLWTIEYAQINLSEIFTLFLIINEPNLWITTLPDFRLVSKNLGNLSWFSLLAVWFWQIRARDVISRGVTKSGDYAANIDFPHAGRIWQIFSIRTPRYWCQIAFGKDKIRGQIRDTVATGRIPALKATDTICNGLRAR